VVVAEVDHGNETATAVILTVIFADLGGFAPHR
jgi:hypothetical protein